MAKEASSTYVPSILIVGGGIAGLAAGLCLTHLIPGITPLIVERHEHLTSLGGPILIPPNGTRVFKSLGLLPSLMAIADDCTVRVLMRGDSGEVLQENMVDSIDGSPYLLAVRGELLKWLHDLFCAKGGRIRFGCQVTEMKEGEDGARLRTADGDVLAADLVVVADGVRSALRPMVIPDFKAHVSSSSTSSVTGCEIPSSHMLRDPLLAKLYRRPGPTVWMGPGRYIVTAPIRRHGLFSVAFSDHGKEVAAHEDWAVAGDLERVRERFSAFVGGGAAELMEAAVAARDETKRRCVNWTAACVGPFTSWRSPLGRVILHGDAAHAMLPDAGQGATQCIESSISLALFCQSARSASDVPMVTYRQEYFRKPRAEQVQRLGQYNSKAFRLQDVQSRYAYVGGDSEMRSLSEAWDEHFEWLYDYDVSREVAKYLEEQSRILR